MRRHASAVIMALLFSAAAAMAGEGKVSKVLPQYLDSKGRETLSPSLYERDAYQAYLRKHPEKRETLHLVVEYRAKGLDWSKAKLRAELRGLVNNVTHLTTLELPVKKTGFFGGWANFDISGSDLKKFGELVAWRVTLTDGEKDLSQRESFLWSGVASR